MPWLERSARCSLELRGEATDLLREVEKCYGKAIREELVADWGPGYWGESEVVDDGTPVLRLNAQTGLNETNIVHELWHLKLTVQGFPKRTWVRLVGAPPEIDQALTHDLNGLLLDAILHWEFYPNMRRMGYDADAWDRPKIKQMMEISLLTGSYAIRTKPILVPLTYFKVCLESSDQQLVTDLEQWYERNKLGKELQIAKQLVKIVKESKTDTPQAVLEVYVRCLNVLFQGSAHFHVASWSSEMLGSFQRQVVTIHISPAN
jgi:hypothetical protein